MAALLIKRLGRRGSVLNALLHLRTAGESSNPNLLLPDVRRYFFAPSLHSKACKACHVSPFSLNSTRGLRVQASPLSDVSDHHHGYEDADTEAAASALQIHLQKHSKAYLSDAAAVVAHAPLYLKRLVDLVKQKSSEKVNGEKEQPEKSLPSSPAGFDGILEKQVLVYLSTENVNVLEPVLESIGLGSDRLHSAVQKLSKENVDVKSLLFVIRWIEKLGFSRESVGNILEKEIRVLSYQRDEIEVGFSMLKGLSIPQEQILNLITKYPLVLKGEVVDNISALSTDLGELPSKEELVIKAISVYPASVHEYKAGRAENVLRFLRSYRLKDEQLGQMLKRHIRLVFLDVDKQLRPNLMFLRNIGLSRAIISKVVRRSPGFLSYDVEDDLKRRLEYFKSLGLSETEFSLMITRYPAIFSASLDRKIKPTVEELKTLGLNEEGLKKVVLYRPSLFSHRLGGDTSVLIASLKESDYSEKQKVTAFIKLCPRGVDHRKKCEDCLLKYGLSASEAKQVLDKEPGILGYNEESIASRLKHLTEKLGLPVQNVLSMPRYLSFPFRKRILRRERVLAYMKSKGLLTEDLTLFHLLSPSNTQFYKKFVEPHPDDQDLSNIWLRTRKHGAKEGDLRFLQDSSSKVSKFEVNL